MKLYHCAILMSRWFDSSLRSCLLIVFIAFNLDEDKDFYDGWMFGFAGFGFAEFGFAVVGIFVSSFLFHLASITNIPYTS